MNNASTIYSRINTQEVFCDLNGVIQHVNNNMFALELGTNIFKIHPFFESIANIVVKEQDVISTYPCVHLNLKGDDRICDVTVKREPHQMILTLLDYTEPYKELNVVAQQRNESIINAQLLVLKNQQLEQQREFKNRFLANISHEIRTPLSAIVGFSDMLKKTKLNYEQEDLTKVILDAGEQLTAIVDDLLDIAKIELGRLDIKSEEFSLSQVIENLTKVYSKKASKKGLTFKTNYDSTIYSDILGDKLRVQQVLGNLTQNALKYTEKGNITLDVKLNFQRANKIGVDFILEDTGIGIPQDKLPNIFESFFQVNSNDDVQGTGLGLAITKNIVEQLGGNIHVESLLTRGSTFRVYLPFNIQLKTSPKLNITKPKKTSIFTDGTKYNLLLVENSEINQLLVVKTLLTHGGFSVDVASNGEKALKHLERRHYHIILMDLNMPVLDGFETTKVIRNLEDKRLRKTPIIALTGAADPEQEKACLAIGMNAYLTKPFRQEELTAVLESVLRAQ